MKLIFWIKSFFLIQNVKSFSISRGKFIKETGLIASLYTIPTFYNGEDESSTSIDNHISGAGTEYPLTIKFYSPVTIESCLGLTTYLQSLDMKSKELKLKYGEVFPIQLHIQSGGGMLMPTFYVCDVIKNLDTPVHIYIDGYVASAASLIAISGDKRFMTKHSFMLIHQLQSQSSGRLNELKDDISNLDFFMNNAKDIYFKNSNITEKSLEKLLSDELWIDSEECLKYGLVDIIM